MKKLIAVLAVVISAGAFAQDHLGPQSPKINKTQMMSKMNHGNVLTKVQQRKINEMKTAQMFKSKKIMLDIKEINIQIQKEWLAKRPNKRKIGKLMDKKSRLQAQNQRDLIKFNIKLKKNLELK